MIRGRPFSQMLRNLKNSQIVTNDVNTMEGCGIEENRGDIIYPVVPTIFFQVSPLKYL